MNTKDIISLSISFAGFIVSIFAFVNSRRASIRSVKVEASNRLSQTQEKIRTGRKVMNDIFTLWANTEGKYRKPDFLLAAGNEQEKNEFLDFYNKKYHSKPNGTEERKLSDEIHTYLHELHHLWSRHLDKEFSEENIMERFSPAINMDSHLITLYLEAHWKEHNELNKEINARFWKYVPVIVEKAKELEGKDYI